jgi:dolichol-phosphate mannosyltransferase
MKIAIVIPCYRVKPHIESVIAGIGAENWRIYVVDDKCPDQSGHYVHHFVKDPRVTVLFNHSNLGVGGATMVGYSAALADGADVIVKLDGDGQMDPRLIPRLVAPLVQGRCDYMKGNRFHTISSLSQMPTIRILGNSILSFVSKCASGYWNVMDPTNGFTAIRRVALEQLPLEKISQRYFFESEMLFRLYIIRAVVNELPMTAFYGSEVSSLNIQRTTLLFPQKYLSCLLKRIFYTYYLRDFNICSVQLLAGVLLAVFGGSFGIYNWHIYGNQNIPTPLGTIALAALPFFMGFQLVLAALNFDVMNIPSVPLQSYGTENQQEESPDLAAAY